MLISAADLAYMKGEAAAQPGDDAITERALDSAAEHAYLVLDARLVGLNRVGKHGIELVNIIELSRNFSE